MGGLVSVQLGEAEWRKGGKLPGICEHICASMSSVGVHARITRRRRRGRVSIRLYRWASDRPLQVFQPTFNVEVSI